MSHSKSERPRAVATRVLWVLLGVLISLVLVASSASAQAPAEEAEAETEAREAEADADSEEAEAETEAHDAEADADSEEAEAETEATEIDGDAPGEPDYDAIPASPAPAPSPAAAPPAALPPSPAPSRNSLRGVAVMAGDAEARGDAKALARAVYADRALRPRMTEAEARALFGRVTSDEPRLVELGAMADAVTAADHGGLQRRLVAELAREVAVELVLLVRTTPVGPRAKVVAMPEGRYLSVELAPETTDDGWDWRDSLAMVRGLVEDKPLPGPRKPDAGGTSKVADPVEEEEEEDNFSFLTSPWFWGGLGVVVTAGVTVLVLSETVFQEHDTVVVEGRITP